MQKQSTDSLSMRNAFALIVVVHMSSTIVNSYSAEAGNDTWIAYLLSLVLVVPLMLMYARMVHLMPGKDLFEMMEFAFGKWSTVAISVFMGFYFITVSAMVRNFYAEFVHQVTLLNTSITIILLSFFCVCAYLAKSGTETMGKWSSIILVFTVVVTTAMVLLAIPHYELSHIQPVLSHPAKQIALTSLKFIPLPIGEIIIIMTMVGGLEKKVNPYKTFVSAGIFSALIFAVIFLRNCAILGEMLMETANYPSHKAASVIHIGSIGTRVESLVAIVFILTGITKVAAALYAGSKAVSKVFLLPSHNQIILSVGFFSVALSTIIFYNTIELFDFINVYEIYAVPFQILIPLVIWLTAEVKVRKQKIPVKKSWKQPDRDTTEPKAGTPQTDS